MKYIKISSYKYELVESLQINLNDENFNQEFDKEYFSLKDNILTIKKGYRWDGASGLITIDTESTMLAALIHDVLYQSIREKYLDKSLRFNADLQLYKLMRKYSIEDAKKNKSKFKKSFLISWSEIRAMYFLIAVRIFGSISCKKKIEPQENIIEI